MMERTIKILMLTLGFILIAAFISCASSNKNPYYEKKKKASHVNTSQVGRNKYFFTPGYQKKLGKTFKGK